MNILIVEDDEPVALILSTLLKPLGKIEIASSLAEMFSRIARPGEVGLVMLDLRLPDSPMTQTLATIRRIKELVPKVVVMTGAYLPDITELAMESGADACFYKGDAGFLSWIKTAARSPGSRSPFNKAT